MLLDVCKMCFAENVLSMLPVHWSFLQNILLPVMPQNSSSLGSVNEQTLLNRLRERACSLPCNSSACCTALLCTSLDAASSSTGMQLSLCWAAHNLHQNVASMLLLSVRACSSDCSVGTTAPAEVTCKWFTMAGASVAMR